MLISHHQRPIGPSFRVATLFAVCAVAWVFLPLVVAADGDGDDKAPGRIAFFGKNMMASADGVFHTWRIAESQVALDDLKAGHVVIEIDVASLDTGIKRRDNHLRSSDFFEVERWPMARVRVHSPSHTGGDQYRATFEIKIRDVTKSIEGTFEIVSRAPLSIRGDLTIDRTDFGVGEPKNWNPMSITNEIPITFEAVLSE